MPDVKLFDITYDINWRYSNYYGPWFCNTSPGFGMFKDSKLYNMNLTRSPDEMINHARNYAAGQATDIVLGDDIKTYVSN